LGSYFTAAPQRKNPTSETDPSADLADGSEPFDECRYRVVCPTVQLVVNVDLQAFEMR
jgi:hypothetical protein